jgi:S-DNA-T family DNA segregation ATPase FtsK/SpoIIIE
MKLLSPTGSKRLNEVTGFVCLAIGLLVLFSLVSYRTYDPSLNTAAGSVRPRNLAGYAGSYLADLLLQAFGLAAFLFPACAFLLGWKWIRSEPIEAPGVKLAGFILLGFSVTAGLGEGTGLRLFGLPASGVVGMLLAHSLVTGLNGTGAVLVTLTAMIVSVYLVSTFTLSKLEDWFGGPLAVLRRVAERAKDWLEERRRRQIERHREKARLRAEERAATRAAAHAERRAAREPQAEITEPGASRPVQPALEFEPEIDQIPICPIEELSPAPVSRRTAPRPPAEPRPVSANFHLPSTDLLNEPTARSSYDEQELKDIAARVKSKFEEFNVLGSVVQINPGPVVTTFEFKPEAGIKYSRITTLNEDLCLALQAESILIERIPGKPTVGIEVPNSRRELISLREVFESEEFASSQSRLTISLGKDINGRIKVAAIDTMPHLLIAGSTGSGKSVMINSLIMSVLYKSTPEDVRMILVDPKRLELGLYEGIPHLLTPVITDPRKATNALRNAVLEMERRLRILAEQGVRNIEQYNKKIHKLQQEPRSLFDEELQAEEPQPLPYILILIDELADLMMIEGRNVEESVTRLAQMARAVGMHLVLATQRPSVDVITGLIKANFPARISFRVATRVDSRTILDVMGADHLLGKGDMLFLPPGSSRLTRVHGAFVTETEINRVVDFWKAQATPEYDQSLLLAPPAEEEEGLEEAAGPGDQDPMYEEALRVVLEMGKASTSTLQRRLRLGYGRAARILDMMHRDGIIGPPDGSKPREVLKRPEWLQEVGERVR